MILYTSQFRYSGPNRVDITYKTNSPFSPDKQLVYDYKYHDMTQQEYIDKYYSLMRLSYKNNRSSWEQLLTQTECVIVCYCKRNTFCHRYLLKDILVKLGAIYKGEI